MKICKLCKFLRGRSSHIPYTSLIGDEKQSAPTQMETLQVPPVNAQPTSSIAPVPLEDIPLPSPFQEMKMLKKPKGGKLTSLGIISVGMSLAGLVVLVEHNGSCPQSEEQSVESTPPVPPRPRTV